MAATPWQVGDRVTIAQTQLCGTIKFIGVTEFAGGEWMGIELDEKAGKNNGCVKGKAYFDCQPDYGIFVRPTAVARIPPGSRRRSSAVPDPTLQPPSAPASPMKQALLGLPSPSAAAAARRSSLRTSRREEEGDRSREIQKASVQLELAGAMEDHDVDAIRRMLPAAQNLGIAREEIAAAKRILSWELKQSMQMEVNAVSRSVSEAVVRLEAVSSAPANPTSSAVSRLGEELQKRVWQKLESKIHEIVDGALSRASTRAGKTASHPLEAYGFEDFDLNGDGIVTRDIFEEARKKIMAGHLEEPRKATATCEPPTLSRPSEPKATKSLVRYLYSRAAPRLKALENHAATRFVVGRLLSRGLQRALMLGPAPDTLAEAKRDIAAIRASRLRIEDATRKAEEIVHAASTRVQAAARGRLVRREKDLVKKSTITLQRALRRLKLRRRGKKVDFSAVVAAATEQRKEWAMEFERVALDGTLEERAFIEALLRSSPTKVSQVQAEKLWAGFLEHSEVPGPMAISTFWAICEAVEQGDELAADFADIPVEEYASYGCQATPQSEEQMRAAQRIQAAQRGRQARRQHQSQAEKQKAAGPEAAPATQGLPQNASRDRKSVV